MKSILTAASRNKVKDVLSVEVKYYNYMFLLFVHLEDLPSVAATRDGTSGGERFSQSPAELRQGGGSKGSSPERQEGPGVSAEGLL